MRSGYLSRSKSWGYWLLGWRLPFRRSGSIVLLRTNNFENEKDNQHGEDEDEASSY